eukprot:scaffold75047_cov22-Tisochrysis_lutea.AAC.3
MLPRSLTALAVAVRQRSRARRMHLQRADGRSAMIEYCRAPGQIPRCHSEYLRPVARPHGKIPTLIVMHNCLTRQPCLPYCLIGKPCDFLCAFPSACLIDNSTDS